MLSNKSDKDYVQIIKNIKEIAPEAVSARSHSMIQGSLIYATFSKLNIKYDVNTLIPGHVGMDLKPPYGLIKVPYFWEDNENHCAIPGQISSIGKQEGSITVITGEGKLKIWEVDYMSNSKAKPAQFIHFLRDRFYDHI